MRVERSEEFVERMTNVSGIQKLTHFEKAHAIARGVNSGEILPKASFHVYDRCQERGITTDFANLFQSHDWILKSGYSKDGTPWVYYLENHDTRFVCQEEAGELILITAYKLVEEERLCFA